MRLLKQERTVKKEAKNKRYGIDYFRLIPAEYSDRLIQREKLPTPE